MKQTLFIFLILNSLNLFSQNSNDSILIVELLKSDYRTLEKFDVQKHVANCTKDYVLIEDGEIWSLQKETEYFKSNANRLITRKDYFSIRKLKIVGTLAYLVYELKSQIQENGKISNKAWTESAVFQKSMGKWKIALIHSTTIERKNS